MYTTTPPANLSVEAKEDALCAFLDVEGDFDIAFLDVEGGFDNTLHEAISPTLKERGIIYRTVVTWIRSMLSTRQAQTVTEEGTISVNTERGCPPGLSVPYFGVCWSMDCFTDL